MAPHDPGPALFVCTFNRVRSPMAAGLTRRLYGGAIAADSCGLVPGESVDPLAAAVMAEIGVDLHHHQPKRLNELIGEGGFGLIVALSQEAWLKVETFAGAIPALCWPIPDPTEQGGSREVRLEVYRMTRRALEARIVQCFGPPSSPIGP